MPDPISPSSADLGELLSTQQRLLEAFARTSRIVAEAARGCAERQAELTRAALHDLLAGTPLAGGVPSTDALQDQVGRMAALLERIGQEVGQMQRIVVEAQQAVLTELGRALETVPGRVPEAAPAAAPDPASPDSPAPEPAAERPRPRRPRKVAVPN